LIFSSKILLNHSQKAMLTGSAMAELMKTSSAPKVQVSK
jgi:hypothetical protein